MVKQTQTIRRQKPTHCLSLFDHFVGLAFKGLKALRFPYRKKVETVNYIRLVSWQVEEKPEAYHIWPRSILEQQRIVNLYIYICDTYTFFFRNWTKSWSYGWGFCYPDSKTEWNKMLATAVTLFILNFTQCFRSSGIKQQNNPQNWLYFLRY